jgi:hypothetical protein
MLSGWLRKAKKQTMGKGIGKRFSWNMPAFSFYPH